VWGATTSEDGHRQVGELGLGLCSFAVGITPAEIKTKVDIYRAAVGACTTPLGAFVNNQAATFTMALCAPDRQQAIDAARQSFEWYPAKGASQIATVAQWMDERQEDLGTYSYAADLKKTEDAGLLDMISLEYLVEANACVLGTPEECVSMCRLYEEAGIDLLLCLVNPYNVSHEAVMQTIELMGTEVIPKFR
jgi:alkanesulfonate monooxygenase SsuD/methylene tetrahydromethanopterin reductase-like flavin-dependent oxidoreductase (luciferase family)